MISLLPAQGDLKVLLLGAHPDDIEIGCGGTLLQLARRPGTAAHAVVMTGTGERLAEMDRALPSFIPGVHIESVGLPDGRLPSHWAEAKEALESAARGVHPDIIFAPRVDDAHQDHRLLGRLAGTVWRDSLILHYEIPKWDGDSAQPTHYVSLSDEDAQAKVRLLMKWYVSQKDRDWWDDELFLGLMRVRGMEARSRYAEGFTTAKVMMGFDRSGVGSTVL